MKIAIGLFVSFHVWRLGMWLVQKSIRLRKFCEDYNREPNLEYPEPFHSSQQSEKVK